LETDGSIRAEDAVAYAARILQDQLSVFVNFEEPAKTERSAIQCRVANYSRRGPVPLTSRVVWKLVKINVGIQEPRDRF